jgi:hypothetical protein
MRGRCDRMSPEPAGTNFLPIQKSNTSTHGKNQPYLIGLFELLCVQCEFDPSREERDLSRSRTQTQRKSKRPVIHPFEGITATESSR